jgi:hypothetical protein
VVQPLKAAIVEALLWLGPPLSLSEHIKLIGDQQFSLAPVSCRVATLTKAGVSEERWARPVGRRHRDVLSRPTITPEQRDAAL